MPDLFPCRRCSGVYQKHRNGCNLCQVEEAFMLVLTEIGGPLKQGSAAISASAGFAIPPYSARRSI
jgi:hypothetical protein